MFCKRLHKSGARSIQRESGQALLELAIFGSLILMILGALVSYGLRYNFQQQADQEVFRKANEYAMKGDDVGDEYGSASYTVIRDRHMPDPSNPFGIGQVSPTMASASITRDHRLDAVGTNYDGLPKMIINFQSMVDGQLVEQEKQYATAGIRRHSQSCGSNENHYNEVRKGYYGLVFGTVGNWCEYDAGEWDDDCSGESSNLRIFDPVEGEIFDYDSAVEQARMLVDHGFCVEKCVEMDMAGDHYGCGTICTWGHDHALRPWYIQGRYQDQQTGEWVFPAIDGALVYPGVGGPYAGRNVLALGLQQDSVQEIETDLRIDKSEDDQGITTTDTTYFSTVTTRNILINDNLDPVSGEVLEDEFNPQLEHVVTNTTDTRSFTWETPW